jgi:hypothetical protein
LTKSLSELVQVDDPAWPELQRLISNCPQPVQVLEPDIHRRERALLNIQNSLASTLGAVIWHTGGVLVDHGWLRILGSGCHKLQRDVFHWATHLGWWTAQDLPPGAPVVADDVLGGLFALNWGQIDPDTGINEVFYFAPDTLGWECLHTGYSAFFSSMLSGGTVEFYKGLRWDGWEIEVSRLTPDQGVSAWPPPWTKEGKDLSLVSRRPVLLREIVGMQFDFARQLQNGS